MDNTLNIKIDYTMTFKQGTISKSRTFSNDEEATRFCERLKHDQEMEELSKYSLSVKITRSYEN